MGLVALAAGLLGGHVLPQVLTNGTAGTELPPPHLRRKGRLVLAVAWLAVLSPRLRLEIHRRGAVANVDAVELARRVVEEKQLWHQRESGRAMSVLEGSRGILWALRAVQSTPLLPALKRGSGGCSRECPPRAGRAPASGR